MPKIVAAHIVLLSLFVLSSPAWSVASSEEISTLIGNHAGREFAERFARYSGAFMGRPYVDAPLGEGANATYDRRPLYSTEGFDCVTYVETVMALLPAANLREFEQYINLVRYRLGNVTFTSRNHFSDLDWIPNNRALGLLTDVSATVAGNGNVRTARALVNKRGWYERMSLSRIFRPDLGDAEKQRLLEQLRLEGRQFEPDVATIPYVSLDTLYVPVPAERIPADERDRLAREEREAEAMTDPRLRSQALDRARLQYRIRNSQLNQALLDRIPSGSVISIVRPNWNLVQAIGTHMNVSHQGLGIRRDRVMYYRYASSVAAPRAAIIDVPLHEYLARHLLSPTIRGFNVQRILDSRPQMPRAD